MHATDFRKLGPSELIRRINTTPLGPVLTARKLEFHRNRAGFRIGTARTIDLIRYAAWLVLERHTPKPEFKPTQDSYEAAKERAAKRSHDVFLSGRDIGAMPAVVNPERKQAARLDFRQFCESYFPATFNLLWSDDHLKVIGQIEESVLYGGLFATAMPRGSGKTSLAVVACIWATVYGHREFISLIGSNEEHSSQMLDSIKTELDGNDLLLDDFPEVCYPISELEGIANRCNGQLYKGERTHIGWTAKEFISPTIPDSPASGVIIKVAGITGGLRGMKHKRRDGKTVRPSLVIIDDPQTDESARSPSQCQTREQILAGAILGLGGPGVKISGIMPCTVIRPGDMADKILDRGKHPEWNGTRTKMVYSFPVADKLWEEYSHIRADSLRMGHGGKEATEFYRENRQAMDEGSQVAWEARHDPDELSAIQHAMNLRLRDERAFFAEYQNEPLPEEDSRPDDLLPDQVMARINRLKRGHLPASCSRITAFIDVQASLLFYVVTAWEDDFTGYILDYGSFPDQQTPYYTLGNARITLASVFKGAALEGQLYGGLDVLTTALCSREWPRDDGAGLRIDRCLIDANWPDSTDSVYRVCRQSAHSAVLTPSRGRYVGASSTPLTEWAKQEGERRGLNWILRPTPAYKSIRLAQYDTNFWKSFVATRFSTAMGDKSALTLFGAKPDEHRMLADQICSEFRVRTQRMGSTREVDEWKRKSGQVDNHLWDCLVGTAVAASIQGVSLMESPRADKSKRLSFTELQRRAQEKRGGPPNQPRA
jgi:hypothetical protein